MYFYRLFNLIRKPMAGKIKIPHTYVIVFFIVVLAGILTWIPFYISPGS